MIKPGSITIAGPSPPVSSYSIVPADSSTSRVIVRLLKQMATQEGQPDGDGPVVAADEGLVVPAGQADELFAPTPLPGVDRGPGKRGAVVVVDEHQKRTPDAGGEGTRPTRIACDCRGHRERA